jgi:predicted nucleic acid-binding protein
LFEDEATPECDALLHRLSDNAHAIVPDLWHLEVGNVLLQASKRQRISSAQVRTSVQLLSQLPIIADGETHMLAFKDVLSLAETYQLTTYDAAYLELAIRHGVPLATQDKALLRASAKLGVDALPN